MIYPDGFYVYAYLRAKNSKNGNVGSPYYVGKGFYDRAYHTHHRIQPPVDSARIIIVADNLLEDQSFNLEKILIAWYGRIDLGTGCLQNRTDGGEGTSGSIPWNKGKINVYSQECLERRRTAMLGKITSEETKQKQTHSAKKRKIHGHTGVPHTEETKDRIRQSILGRTQSPETIEKKRMAALGKTQSVETIQKRIETRRKNKNARIEQEMEARI